MAKIKPGTPWAICEGGLIQDSADDVVCIDLDWMDHDGVDLDEAERCWEVLVHVVNVEKHTGWSNYLHEVEEHLTTLYKDYDVPEEEKIWNQEEHQ